MSPARQFGRLVGAAAQLQARITAAEATAQQASALARTAQERAEAVQQAEDARRVRGIWAAQGGASEGYPGVVLGAQI